MCTTLWRVVDSATGSETPDDLIAKLGLVDHMPADFRRLSIVFSTFHARRAYLWQSCSYQDTQICFSDADFGVSVDVARVAASKLQRDVHKSGSDPPLGCLPARKRATWGSGEDGPQASGYN